MSYKNSIGCNTIGEHIRDGSTITAYCRNLDCRHSATLDLTMLQARLGPDQSALLYDLAPKLRCSACGGKLIGFSIGSNLMRFGARQQ